MDFNAFLNLTLSLAVGYITYTLKERDKRIETEFRNLKTGFDDISKSQANQEKNMYRIFVTKDEHSRDMNALERKIDDIKDILMGIKEDIGHLNGRQEK